MAENPKVMLDSPTDLTPPWPMAFAVIVLIIAFAMLFARAYGRRVRRRVRQQAHDIARDFSAFLDGRLAVLELKETVADAAPGAFWGALEPIATHLPRAEWLKLARALDRNRHADAERNALRNDSPWRAELAARRLGLVYSPRSRKALRWAMVNGTQLVSIAAARALARYEDMRALRWLLLHPETLRKRSTRQWVVLLRNFGARAYPALIEGLAAAKDYPILERAIVEALGFVGDLSAAAAIERRLDDSDLEMRVAAARALGRLGAAQCSASLTKALRDDEWQVRAQAAWALGRIREQTAVYALTTKLTDRSWWVRRHAAYALAEMGEQGHNALLHTCETSEDPYARDIAEEALSARRNGHAA